jgi:hypothetical protein
VAAPQPPHAEASACKPGEARLARIYIFAASLPFDNHVPHVKGASSAPSTLHAQSSSFGATQQELTDTRNTAMMAADQRIES